MILYWVPVAEYKARRHSKPVSVSWGVRYSQCRTVSVQLLTPPATYSLTTLPIMSFGFSRKHPQAFVTQFQPQPIRDVWPVHTRLQKQGLVMIEKVTHTYTHACIHTETGRVVPCVLSAAPGRNPLGFSVCQTSESEVERTTSSRHIALLSRTHPGIQGELTTGRKVNRKSGFFF